MLSLSSPDGDSGTVWLVNLESAKVTKILG